MPRPHRQRILSPGPQYPVSPPATYYLPPPLAPHSFSYQHAWSSHDPYVKHKKIPFIPPEIIAEIIGFISDEDTLVTCQKISKAFQYPARKKLFYAVTIDFPSRAGTVTRKTPLSLYMKVARFPDIAKIVHHLVVNTGPDRQEDFRDLEYAQIEDYQRSSLAKAIPLLTSLRTLEFPYRMLRAQVYNIAKKPTVVPFFPPVTSAQAYHITKLDISALRGYQFPSPTQLAVFQNLQQLTLDFNGLLPHSEGYATGASRKRPLALLRIVGDSVLKESLNVILSPAFPFDIMRTRTLDFDQSLKKNVLLDCSGCVRDLTGLTQLLQFCESLTEFKFGPCPSDKYQYTYTGFNILYRYSKLAAPPSLAGLRLEKLLLRAKVCNIPIREHYGSGVYGHPVTTLGSPLRWITNLLETVQVGAPIPLKEIKLDLSFEYFQTRELLELLSCQWEGLRQVLMSHRFPRLRKVYLRMRYEPNPSIGVRGNEEFRKPRHSALDTMFHAGLLIYDF